MASRPLFGVLLQPADTLTRQQCVRDDTREPTSKPGTMLIHANSHTPHTSGSIPVQHMHQGEEMKREIKRQTDRQR